MSPKDQGKYAECKDIGNGDPKIDDSSDQKDRCADQNSQSRCFTDSTLNVTDKRLNRSTVSPDFIAARGVAPDTVSTMFPQAPPVR